MFYFMYLRSVSFFPTTINTEDSTAARSAQFSTTVIPWHDYKSDKLDISKIDKLKVTK